MGESHLFAAAALGYRFWFVAEEHLLSATNGLWEPGVNRAACWRSTGHPAPQGDCTCGLHAYHELSAPLRHTNSFARHWRPGDRDEAVMIGAVAGRGALEVHWSGWRAAEGQVLGLLATPVQIASGLAAEIAGRYRVPYFGQKAELEAHARRLAAPIDPAFRPDPPLSGPALERFARRYRRSAGDPEEVAELAEELSLRLDEVISLAEYLGL